jgi:hypothetical protein
MCMDGTSRYWLPRLLFQQGLGLVYSIAFLVAVKLMWFAAMSRYT